MTDIGGMAVGTVIIDAEGRSWSVRYTDFYDVTTGTYATTVPAPIEVFWSPR